MSVPSMHYPKSKVSGCCNWEWYVAAYSSGLAQYSRKTREDIFCMPVDIQRTVCHWHSSSRRSSQARIPGPDCGMFWDFEIKSKYLITVIQNTFSERLGQTGFDFFLMLVVDLLHKFELGVWKSIFIHLLRIVNSLKGTILAELDCRWDSLLRLQMQ